MTQLASGKGLASMVGDTGWKPCHLSAVKGVASTVGEHGLEARVTFPVPAAVAGRRGQELLVREMFFR